MSALKLTLACRDYDHTRGLEDGSVTIEGAELQFISVSPPSQIFLRMLNSEEFDISEMSLSNFMIALEHGDRRFVAIPVFPARVFRHSYIWVRTDAGIERPQDLKGKRIGIADYTMTALLFVRGMLKHEYGVAPEDIHWYRRRAEHVATGIPSGIRIDNIDKDSSLDQMLEEGKLDAVALTAPPRAFRQGSPVVKRLFSNPREVEAAYYRKTGVFPIMHIIVMRRAVYEQHRWLAAALMNGFQLAKQRSFERFREGLYPLPWQNLDFDFARSIMGEDIYSYGLKQNLATLEAATVFSYEQGLTNRQFELKELFAPETLDF